MNLPEREDMQQETEPAKRKGFEGMLRKPYITSVLLAVIAVLLICIIVLIVVLPGRRTQQEAKQSDDQLQQSIAEYAQEQKQKESEAQTFGKAIVVEPSPKSKDGQDSLKEQASSEPAGAAAQDSSKTAVIVEDEDEDDISYTKEYILNEAFPYFESNNQEAIWDLAHLKRYIKLSGELKGTNSYYYQGDVNDKGKPDGVGLAVYEENSYYYGEWKDGVRSGEGRWFRFYIGKKNKANAMGKYLSHSYAGTWADDLPNGAGAEHYDIDLDCLEYGERILANVVGEFEDGLYNGEMFANTIDFTGNVEEWYANAEKGVFALWRDMSSIGECSVWENREDSQAYIYMEIDKSENKNQGIRELLKK